jgi:hypothetical protein
MSDEPRLDPELQALAWKFSRATARQILRSMRYIEEYADDPGARWALLRAILERFAAGDSA